MYDEVRVASCSAAVGVGDLDWPALVGEVACGACGCFVESAVVCELFALNEDLRALGGSIYSHKHDICAEYLLPRITSRDRGITWADGYVLPLRRQRRLAKEQVQSLALGIWYVALQLSEDRHGSNDGLLVEFSFFPSLRCECAAVLPKRGRKGLSDNWLALVVSGAGGAVVVILLRRRSPRVARGKHPGSGRFEDRRGF